MTETMEIIIKHKCQGCGLSINKPGKDRFIGYVKKGYPEGWEKVREINICTSCVQGWNARKDAEWIKYKEEMKKKGLARRPEKEKE